MQCERGLPFKSSVVSKMFLFLLSSPRLYLIENTVKTCNIVKYYYIFKLTVLHVHIFYNIIYSCDGKAEFSASLLSLQSHQFFLKKHLLIILNIKNIVLFHISVEAVTFFSVFMDEQKSSKERTASLLNRIINFFQKNNFFLHF